MDGSGCCGLKRNRPLPPQGLKKICQNSCTKDQRKNPYPEEKSMFRPKMRFFNLEEIRPFVVGSYLNVCKVISDERVDILSVNIPTEI